MSARTRPASASSDFSRSSVSSATRQVTKLPESTAETYGEPRIFPPGSVYQLYRLPAYLSSRSTAETVRPTPFGQLSVADESEVVRRADGQQIQPDIGR